MVTTEQIKTFISSNSQLAESVSLDQVSNNEDFIKISFTNKENNRFHRVLKVYQTKEGLTVKVSNVYDHTDMYDFKRWLVLSPDDLFTWLDYFLPQVFSYWNHSDN